MVVVHTACIRCWPSCMDRKSIWSYICTCKHFTWSFEKDFPKKHRACVWLSPKNKCSYITSFGQVFYNQRQGSKSCGTTVIDLANDGYTLAMACVDGVFLHHLLMVLFSLWCLHFAFYLSFAHRSTEEDFVRGTFLSITWFTCLRFLTISDRRLMCLSETL